MYPFKTWITKTLTLVFRKSALSNMSLKVKQRYCFSLFLMKSGKGYYFNEIMGYIGCIMEDCFKQGISRRVNDGYIVLKDLYYCERQSNP